MKNLICLFVAFALCSCGAPASSPAPTQILVASGGINHFPFSFNPNPDNTLVHYSTHIDAVVSSPVDAGRLLDKPAFFSHDFYLSGVVNIGAGLLYGASYIATANGPSEEIVHGWTSSNGGLTWTKRTGTLHLPEAQISRDAGWGGLLYHRRLHLLPGGAIGGTVYGGYTRDRKPDGGEWYRTAWAVSADQGLNWSIQSTIAEGPAGTEGYAEPVSAICPDGRILVIMRTGPKSVLRWSRSADNGRSWSAPVDIDGRFTGWDPDLLALSGGLVLSWGITNEAHVATSQDCGTTWNHLTDYDIATTSGYTGLAFYKHQLMLFTDRAAETEIWGYRVPGLSL